jgi:hypothetical protein
MRSCPNAAVERCVDCGDNSRGQRWEDFDARGERKDFGEVAPVQCAEDIIGGISKGSEENESGVDFDRL